MQNRQLPNRYFPNNAAPAMQKPGLFFCREVFCMEGKGAVAPKTKPIPCNLMSNTIVQGIFAPIRPFWPEIETASTLLDWQKEAFYDFIGLINILPNQNLNS